MVRPRTPITSHGTISVREVAPGKWRARTRYRFDDGTLRQIERFAPTKSRANTSLQMALTTAASSSGGNVRRETHLSDLADRFLLTKADRAPRTVDTYRQTIEHLIKPRIGSLSVSEATTERLGRFISDVITQNGPGAAKACRAVLSGMMGVAARSDAVRVNPVREIDNIARSRAGAVAIPLPELPHLLAAVSADERLRELDHVDVMMFLAATGCRLGEVLAVQWGALDLMAGTVAIRANVIRARGQGVLLQDHTKTTAGARTIAIPQSLVDVLRHRQESF
ncbi:hypothetical protein JF66_19615, partial [Cryobacterium sp. MLB-32]